MKKLVIFLALLFVVAPISFAGQVAGKDTVNGWCFWKVEGENQDTTWTYLTNSAISGKSSQVFGVRSYGPTKYYWVKKLDKRYAKPAIGSFWLNLDTITTKRADNGLNVRIFIGNSEKLSDVAYVSGFGLSNLSIGGNIPLGFSADSLKEDSLDVIVFCLSFVLNNEKVMAEFKIDDLEFNTGGKITVIDDGGEPKFPQLKVAKPKINFGVVAKNSTKLDSVTVTNTGDAPLVISKLWTDDSSFSAHCSTITVAPQASTNVVVEFAQDSLPGQKRAKLYIEHNASGKTDSIELVADFATSVKDENLTPNEFGLSQNYPNPFNPSTSIKYSVSGTQYVRLAVYDMLGREVAVLVDGERKAGEHSVDFSANNLSSGTYIYRLQAGSFAATKKMVLMK